MKRIVFVCGLSALTLVVAGCGSAAEGEDGAQDSASESAPPALETFETPTEFAGDPVPLSLGGIDLNVAGEFHSTITMAGGVSYATVDGGVTATDLATGEDLWSTTVVESPSDVPIEVMFTTEGPQKPLVDAEAGTVDVAVQTRAEDGTDVLRAARLDAESGEVTAQVDHEVEDGLPVGATVEVLASDESGAVVTTPNTLGTGTTFAVDFTDSSVTWASDGNGLAAGDETVVVIGEIDSRYPQLTGLSRADGTKSWGGTTVEDAVLDDTQAVVLPDGSFLVSRLAYQSRDEGQVQVVEARSGEVVREIDGTFDGTMCASGDLAVDASTNVLRAVDSTDLSLAWSLDEDPPSVVALFGEGIYTNQDGGSQVVDAATGEELAPGPEGRFVEVGESGAIMLTDQGGEAALTFVPATG